MRNVWTTGLALSLGLLLTSVRAEEPTWRAVATTSTASPAPAGGPIASSRPRSAETPAPAAGPAAVLGRPVAIARPRLDPAVQPVSFSSQRDPLAPVARGSAPEGDGARPMPVGPPGQSGPAPGMHTWQPADVLASAGSTQLPIPTPANNAVPFQGAPLLPGNAMPGNAIPPGVANNVPVGPIPANPSLFGSGCDCGRAAPCGPAPCCAAPCPTGPCCAPTCGSGPCGSGGCGGGCGCPPGNLFYVGLEYLLWTMKGDATPPLVTQGLVNPAFPFAGAIGPGTSVLYGGKGLGNDLTSGARLTLGWWFSQDHIWGVQASGFFLGPVTNHFSSSSLGMPILARPIIDLNPASPLFGMESRELVASPMAVAGQVDVNRRSQLWGADVNLTRGLLCGECGYLNLLGGWRILGLDEKLTVVERLQTGLSSPATLGLPVGTMIRVADSFSTTNTFNGGQLGLEGLWRVDRWTFGLTGKVALGVTQQRAQIDGSTTIQVPSGMTATLPGGLLALQGTNIGSYSRSLFTVVPEAQFTIGYQITNWMRATIGYNFLYWSNVARPGGQIDRGVNTSFLPLAGPATGAARPTFRFDGSDFWAQGLTAGLQFTW